MEKLTYQKYLNLKESEKLSLLDICKKKFNIQEKINFEVKVSDAEYMTNAFTVKAFNKRLCSQSIFSAISSQINEEVVPIMEKYKTCDGIIFETMHEYKFESTEEYCYFQYFCDKELIDSGYIYVDFNKHDTEKEFGTLEVSTLKTIFSEEHKNEIYLMFSEVIDESIQSFISYNQNKQIKEDVVDHDLWLKQMGIDDLYNEKGEFK